MTITCADCGAMQIIPPLPRGGAAECYRCHRVLARRTKTGLDLTLACAMAICILIPAALFTPVMDSTIRKLGFIESPLVSSVPVIYGEVWFPFAFGFLFFAFLFPAFRALFQIIVLGSLRWGWRIRQPGRIFRWSEQLRTWSMTDVVVIAGVIAYFRASAHAGAEAGVGAWCYLAVAILAFISDRSMDRRAVWNAILPHSTSVPDPHVVSCDVCEGVAPSRRSGDRCPRCGHALDCDNSLRFVLAVGATAAAIALSLPAFTAAIIVNDNVTGVWQHTFLGTVQLLADHGYWQYGVVVLLAAVVIPAIELIGLIWLLARVRFPSTRGLVTRTRVYRVLQRLARWPMIILFIAAIAAPVVDVRGIHELVAGPGAAPLFLVIALLMFAVVLFKPKLMWGIAASATQVEYDRQDEEGETLRGVA
jgi:paraquat-inducible protein A